ncbi:unnamed protein product, partial [Urochloa humidicola]
STSLRLCLASLFPSFAFSTLAVLLGNNNIGQAARSTARGFANRPNRRPFERSLQSWDVGSKVNEQPYC